jgi:hypothetical protein
MISYTGSSPTSTLTSAVINKLYRALAVEHTGERDDKLNQALVVGHDGKRDFNNGTCGAITVHS